MGTSHSHGLAFLLSLGAIPLACADGKDDASAGETTGPTGTDATTSTAGTTASTTAASTTAATTDPTETTGMSTSTTGGLDELCGMYAQKSVECYAETPEVWLCYCQNRRDFAEAVGPACQQAMDAYFECTSTASGCELVEVCAAEDEAAATACFVNPPETPPGPACTAWGEKYVECFYNRGDAAYEAAFCQDIATSLIYSYGEECGQAYEDLYACLGNADCAEIDAETVCAAEDAAYMAICTGSCDG